jgi:hypothetical protein
MFEMRSIRPDPLHLRRSFPQQAFGCKVTLGYEKRLDDQIVDDQLLILIEAMLDNFAISMDSHAWVRFLQFVTNAKGGGFDERWHTGDWTGIMTRDMLLRPSEPLVLANHVQPVFPTFLDVNEFPSSDLFNANIKITAVSVRLPASAYDDPRSCDVILALDRSSLNVSSILPVHLMENSQLEYVTFPHDKSDHVHRTTKDKETVNSTSTVSSVFRCQCSCSGLSLQLSPTFSFLRPKEDDFILLTCC